MKIRHTETESNGMPRYEGCQFKEGSPEGCQLKPGTVYLPLLGSSADLNP